MKKYARMAFALTVTVYWTSLMIVWMIIQVFKHKMAFFSQKKREQPPKVLDGLNHDSAKLSVITVCIVHCAN
jgi:hypothetical protein